MTQALNVWMNGELVGVWTINRGSHAFRYDALWLESPHRRSLSLSLPINSSLESKGDDVKNYFDNLLPDNENIRKRLAKKFSADSDTFGLLEAIGRDCVGAVQLLPDDMKPTGWNQIDCDPLAESDIEDMLESVPSDSTPGHDDDLFRISLAGAQEKTALTRYRNQWCLPKGTTPTTHIFKLPLGVVNTGGSRVDMSDSVENEWLCAQIVTALGLPVANTSFDRFGAQTVLLVERFDRQWMDDDTWIARLPQEDFCQALGVSPAKKYEQHGGPSMQKCLQLLTGSVQSGDPFFFLLTQLTFFLLRASDGHAKNYSIFMRRDDAYHMTPLYDILSMWPYMGESPGQIRSRKAGMAMALRSTSAHYRFSEIYTRHWKGLAKANGGLPVWVAMIGLVIRVDKALADVERKLPDAFPTHTWTAISEGMRSAANHFLSTLPE